MKMHWTEEYRDTIVQDGLIFLAGVGLMLWVIIEIGRNL